MNPNNQVPNQAPQNVPVDNAASAQPRPAVPQFQPVTQAPNGGFNDKQAGSRVSRKVVAALVALAVIVTLAFAGFTWNNSRAADGLIETDNYQAVFLTNGQVYFGKLDKPNGEFFRLTDIYYLQVEGALQAADTEANEGEEAKPADSSAPQLIKLGQEVHGPKDEMVIGANQVLFFENLTDEGTVAKSIAEYQKSQQEQKQE